MHTQKLKIPTGRNKANDSGLYVDGTGNPAPAIFVYGAFTPALPCVSQGFFLIPSDPLFSETVAIIVIAFQWARVRRPQVVRTVHANALSDADREEIRRIANEPRFTELPPARIVLMPVAGGVYVANGSSFSRVPRAHGQSGIEQAKPPRRPACRARMWPLLRARSFVGLAMKCHRASIASTCPETRAAFSQALAP